MKNLDFYTFDQSSLDYVLAEPDSISVALNNLADDGISNCAYIFGTQKDSLNLRIIDLKQPVIFQEVPFHSKLFNDLSREDLKGLLDGTVGLVENEGGLVILAEDSNKSFIGGELSQIGYSLNSEQSCYGLMELDDLRKIMFGFA